MYSNNITYLPLWISVISLNLYKLDFSIPIDATYSYELICEKLDEIPWIMSNFDYLNNSSNITLFFELNAHMALTTAQFTSSTRIEQLLGNRLCACSPENILRVPICEVRANSVIYPTSIDIIFNILPSNLSTNATLQKTFRLITVDLTQEYTFSTNTYRAQRGTYILIASYSISGYPTIQAATKLTVS